MHGRSGAALLHLDFGQRETEHDTFDGIHRLLLKYLEILVKRMRRAPDRGDAEVAGLASRQPGNHQHRQQARSHSHINKTQIETAS